MTYTPSNYISESCNIPISRLPGPLKKGHHLALKAFDNNASAYKANDIVKTSMDHYLNALNEFMAKEQTTQSLSNDPNAVATSTKNNSAVKMLLILHLPKVREIEIRKNSNNW